MITKKSVAEWAELLDAIKPGWFELIDDEKLVTLSSSTSCVLGQIYGGYTNALPVIQEAVGAESAVMVCWDQFCYDRFLPEWREEIAARRAAPPVSPEIRDEYVMVDGRLVALDTLTETKIELTELQVLQVRRLLAHGVSTTAILDAFSAGA